LDSSHWESYFRADDPDTSVAVVDVPDVRRFPIKTFHLGDQDFPIQPKQLQQLLKQRKHGSECDEALCTTRGTTI
jgi:hypothetical protein